MEVALSLREVQIFVVHPHASFLCDRFWAATKAIFIGIPLWIMLRVAARQARREQYEAMLRGAAYGGGGDSTGRRMVFRMQPPQTGINAV